MQAQHLLLFHSYPLVYNDMHFQLLHICPLCFHAGFTPCEVQDNARTIQETGPWEIQAGSAFSYYIPRPTV